MRVHPEQEVLDDEGRHLRAVSKETCHDRVAGSSGPEQFQRPSGSGSRADGEPLEPLAVVEEAVLDPLRGLRGDGAVHRRKYPSVPFLGRPRDDVVEGVEEQGRTRCPILFARAPAARPGRGYGGLTFTESQPKNAYVPPPP